MASLPVKEYLKSVTAEQLEARIIPKQATPLFLNKLLLLSRHLDRKLKEPNLSPSSLFVIARDQAFFKTLFFSGDRGSDLGHAQSQEIIRFPQDNGFLFNHVWGETLCDGTSNMFGIHRQSNHSLCPIKAIETYFAVASELRISLHTGYIFRPTDNHGAVLNSPLKSNAAEARLLLYLKEATIYDGETLHSFRSDSPITLALCGSPLADITSHVGWTNKPTALYYLKIAEVLQPGGPSDVLSSHLTAASLQYAEISSLRNFISVSSAVWNAFS